MPRISPRDKPIAWLRTFTRQLGWSRLRSNQHLLEERKQLVRWYQSGDSNCSRNNLFLQINECPIGQTATYTAAVYAIRYRICTGWHSLELGPDAHHLEREVERLDHWLHRRWFDSPANRREYRKMHPECSGWSWKRIRHESLPYEVVDAARCITARSV